VEFAAVVVEVEISVEVEIAVLVEVDKEVAVRVVLFVMVELPDGRFDCKAETPTMIPAAISIPTSAISSSLLGAFIFEIITACHPFEF